MQVPDVPQRSEVSALGCLEDLCWSVLGGGGGGGDGGPKFESGRGSAI
jgi:hypothetical protein